MAEKKRKAPPSIDQTQKICEAVKEASKEIISARQRNEQAENLRKLLAKCTLMFSELKQLNRETYGDIESKKSEHQKEKVKVDSLNLQLQNLIYEKNYLKREIQSCKDFRYFIPGLLE
jgi:hypothetical protein